MDKYLTLAALVIFGAAVADIFAHRDEVAARRFRELNPATVEGALDRLRNNRWHALGLAQRLLFAVAMAGLVGLQHSSYLAGLVGFLVCGFTSALVFDLAFNIRLRLPWYYVGTTAKTDALLIRLGLGTVAPGKIMTGAEALGLVLSIAAWLVFVV